jgi:hypothetical protein
MLGRLTYESNPETGATQYIYDSLTSDANCGTISSPGDLVKKVDNIGNVACFTYDGLHRVTSVSYPNASPATPTKVFVYDSATVNGTTMALTVGRLAEAYTCTTCTPSPTKLTDIGFSYSARGEITDVYESTPHSAGYNHVNTSYWAHGSVASLNLVGSSLPTISYGGLDGEGRVTTVTAGTSTTLASGVTYTTSGTTEPIGSLTAMAYGSGDSDSFTYDTNTGRLTGYIFNMSSHSQIMLIRAIAKPAVILPMIWPGLLRPAVRIVLQLFGAKASPTIRSAISTRRPVPESVSCRHTISQPTSTSRCQVVL